MNQNLDSFIQVRYYNFMIILIVQAKKNYLEKEKCHSILPLSVSLSLILVLYVDLCGNSETLFLRVIKQDNNIWAHR